MASVRLCKEPDTSLTEKLVIALSVLLAMRAAVPTAAGSGRASTLHKIHAVAHSERLQSLNWRAVVALINSTWTWTGDLGTESYVTEVRIR